MILGLLSPSRELGFCFPLLQLRTFSEALAQIQIVLKFDFIGLKPLHVKTHLKIKKL